VLLGSRQSNALLEDHGKIGRRLFWRRFKSIDDRTD